MTQDYKLGKDSYRKTEQEEFEFALNEAAIYFDGKEDLVVAFGEGKIASLELKDDNERSIIKTIMGDENTWTIFLGSLSTALKLHE